MVMNDANQGDDVGASRQCLCKKIPAYGLGTISNPGVLKTRAGIGCYGRQVKQRQIQMRRALGNADQEATLATAHIQ